MALDRTARVYKEKLNTIFVDSIPRNLTPNQVTFIGFIFGLISSLLCLLNMYFLALVFWALNRFIDGIDGSYARKTKQESTYGGFLDIVFDFIVYCLIPFGISIQKDEKLTYILCAYMLSTFCVNAVCQFYLAAILESKQAGAKLQKEMTTVTFPPALIEGTETVVFFFLFIIFHEYINMLFGLFSLGVSYNVIQRIIEAKDILYKLQQQQEKK